MPLLGADGEDVDEAAAGDDDGAGDSLLRGMVVLAAGVAAAGVG